MTRRIFITGTDTGIGKTLVGQLLVETLVERGQRVAVMKPVASGATVQQGELQNEDAQILRQASNVDAAYERINPYCFEPAIAPHIAAHEAKVDIDLHNIAEHAAQLSGQADWLIVEGVGGVMVPLDQQHDVRNLIEILDCEVLLVVGMRLGCINHARMSEQVLQNAGFDCVGWIGNCIDKDMLKLQENLDTLRRSLAMPALGVLPFLAANTAEIRPEMSKIIENILDS